MAYKVRLTRLAFKDLEDAFRHIAEELESPKAAQRLMRRLETGVLHLADAPYSAPALASPFFCLLGYRKLVISHYAAIYKVDDSAKEIAVIRVVHCSMNYYKYL